MADPEPICVGVNDSNLSSLYGVDGRSRALRYGEVSLTPFQTILLVAMLPFICLGLVIIHPLALFAFVACAILIADRILIDRERNHSPIPYQ